MAGLREALRFGDFVLDVAAYELRRQGRRIRLERQPMDLLILLVERRPDLVTRSEIADRLWGRDVFVDIETGIHTAVRKVRQALRDLPDRPSFILTVPGKGYRFIGAVELVKTRIDPLPAAQAREPVAHESAALGPSPGGSTARAVPPMRARRRRLVALLGLTMAAAVAGAGLWRWLGAERAHTPVAEGRSPVAQSSRLVASVSGPAGGPSFSPDGRMVAYHQWPERQIWIQRLDGSSRPRQLTSDQDEAVFPTWTPGGGAILFTRGNEIWSVSPGGGPPKRLVADGRFPSLSADGRVMAFEGVPPDRGIYLANPDGSGRRLLLERTSADDVPGVSWAHATLSPDGSLVAYLEYEAPGVADLWVAPVAGGAPRRLTFDRADTGRPAWMPDGQALVFHSSRSGSQTVWRIAANGGSPEPVTTGAGQDRNPAVSPDGRQIIYQNVRFGSALTVVDVTTRRVSSLLESREGLLHPRFSPDGRRLTYFSRTDGAFRVFSIAAKSPTLVVGQPVAMGLFPRWSGDGQFMYVLAEDRASLLKVASRGGEPFEAVASLPGADVRPRPENWLEMAPTERSFVYTRREGDIAVATAIVDRATGRERRLTMPLAQFRWSHDGRSIVGTHLDHSARLGTGRIIVCSPDSGECREVTRGYYAVPSADGRRVLFSRFPRDPLSPLSLWEVGLDGSGEAMVAELPEPLPQSLSFDVSNDRQVVYSRFVQGRGELWLAELR